VLQGNLQCSFATSREDQRQLHPQDAYNSHMLFGWARTIPFALAFAGLLQGGNAIEQQPIAPATSAASTGQEAKQGGESVLATILQSGSTNSRAYKVLIHNDGSAAVEFNDPRSDSSAETPQLFSTGTIDVVTLRSLLTEIGDVSKIQTGGCAKSASFGTRTQITYAGRTSGDLQCILHESLGGDQVLLHSSEDLGRFVQGVLGQLKIDSRRIAPSQ
jgi:hypothetical protein